MNKNLEVPTDCLNIGMSKSNFYLLSLTKPNTEIGVEETDLMYCTIH